MFQDLQSYATAPHYTTTSLGATRSLSRNTSRTDGVECKPETSNSVSLTQSSSEGGSNSSTNSDSGTVSEKGSNDGVAGETGSPSL